MSSDLKDVVQKISTPLQLIGIIVVGVIQVASSPNLSSSPLAIVSVSLLVGLAFFVIYLSRQRDSRSLADTFILRFEILIEWIEEFKVDKVEQPPLIHELDLRLKELKLSLAFCNTQKRRQEKKIIK